MRQRYNNALRNDRVAASPDPGIGISDKQSSDAVYKMKSSDDGDCRFQESNSSKKSIKMAAARTLRIGTIALVLRSCGSSID